MKKWRFGINNDNLVNLVLQGKKCATTSLDIENILEGEESIKLYDISLGKKEKYGKENTHSMR